jgi:NAD(P)-dependent dehydrogenase (short-subunit alcohol dehydrogenase family)
MTTGPTLKPVLVTGASSGIGYATALMLAGKGFRVFAGARRVDKLQELAIRSGGHITPIALDVTSASSIAAAMRAITDGGARLYGLVNNAGVSVTGPIEETPIEEWRRQFETNVFGVVAMTQAALPGMRAAKEGRIINVGSVAGRIVAPFMGAYGASKHALEGLTDALRREVGRFGVKVSLVRPGFINTPFGEQEQEGFARAARQGGPYAEAASTFKAWHAKGHPTGAAPDDVARAIHHALIAARPHSRYTAPARYLGSIILRNTMPSAITDRVFERVTGLYRLQEK